ncbi:MAG: Flp pilus assembly complex ATPase component TadA [Bdellovibrionales bacterium]|nr:Flp pilus assembly complex ATPase component TadA [Bdellovibrionales bacterium]
MNSSINFLFKQIDEELNRSNPFENINNFENHQVDEEHLSKTIELYTKKSPIAVKSRIENEYFKFGPLEELIDNENISEILINGPKSIFYEENGIIKQHQDYFFSDRTYLNFIDRFCSNNRTTLDLHRPSAKGKWRNYRFHIIAPPLCEQYHCMSLRKHQNKYIDLNYLIETGWTTMVGYECLKHIVDSKANALIIGPTGTGKTTVLNSLLNLLPNNERIICIEDTNEIKLPNQVSLKLLTRENAIDQKMISFDQSELLKESLRLRPDRIVVGEIRGKEAKDFLLALSTGHKGALCTLHAKTAKEALWRLEILTQMGASEWNLNTIRGIINTGIDYIIELNEDHKRRSLKSIKKLTSNDGPSFLLEEVWPNKLSF